MGVLFRQVLLSLIVSVKTGLYYDSLGAIAFFLAHDYVLCLLLAGHLSSVWIVVLFCFLLLRFFLWVSLGCIRVA